MSKDQKSSKSAPSKSKKGSVINRRANRTVDQSRAASSPKWVQTGRGTVLVRIVGEKAYIQRGSDNKWVSSGPYPTRENAALSITLAPTSESSEGARLVVEHL